MDNKQTATNAKSAECSVTLCRGWNFMKKWALKLARLSSIFSVMGRFMKPWRDGAQYVFYKFFSNAALINL